MTCSKPIDVAVLADYWSALLPEDDEASVEEHLLGCDTCGDRLRQVIAIAEGVRNLARAGTLRIIVSDAFLERAAQEGLRIRTYTVPVGGRVECTVTAEDDLLIGRLAVNVSAAKRVDIAMFSADGTEISRQMDIPFHRATTSVAFQYPIDYAKAAPSEALIFKLVAVDESGDVVLGEYTFNHTRTMPGPPAR
ncbi:MAG TPA: hypothetical protein VFY29_16215 [Terriglobia bacterium]|nr:hypothetical protein [Terriglobia bacterium]